MHWPQTSGSSTSSLMAYPDPFAAAYSSSASSYAQPCFFSAKHVAVGLNIISNLRSLSSHSFAQKQTSIKPELRMTFVHVIPHPCSPSCPVHSLQAIVQQLAHHLTHSPHVPHKRPQIAHCWQVGKGETANADLQRYITTHDCLPYCPWHGFL